MKKYLLLLLCAIGVIVVIVDADSLLLRKSGNLAVILNVAEKAAPVSPNMYGVFFEEVNHSGDGGLYAELVQNRSFEDNEIPEGFYLEDGELKPMPVKNHLSGEVNEELSFRYNDKPVIAWSLQPADESVASMRLSKWQPKFESAPNNLEVTIRNAENPVQLINEGYWGMNIEKGQRYTLRTIIRKASNYSGRVIAKLISECGCVIGQTEICPVGSDVWVDDSVSIEATASDSRARLALEFDAVGTVWLDYVSLFPPTFKNRENGMRTDVAEYLAALKPAFLRWPGGCVVEGVLLASRFEWKKMLGDPAARPGEYTPWGYRCSYGMGYHEMLQYCEDIGAKMMFVCNVGIGCQYRMGDACPESEIAHYLDECMDAIEYAIGSVDTEWGALRAKNGHPEAFPLQYVEIGNENWGPEYDRRFDIFYKAIKAKYPQLLLIYADMSGMQQEEPTICKTDIIDPHWYVAPNFFYGNTTLFDNKQRGEWDVYVGEYACNKGVGGGNMNAALSEAAFISGMERNGDLVTMTSYAPLFENVNKRDWETNLIWIDTDCVMGRASYYVQKMYAENRPTYNIPADKTAFNHVVKEEYRVGAIGLGANNTEAEYKDIRVTEGESTTIIPDVKSATEMVTTLCKGEYGKNLVMELKARKTGGSEGFVVSFGMEEDCKSGYRIYVGGYAKSFAVVQRFNEHTGEVDRMTDKVFLHIEPDRWYDLRIEITPRAAKLYVDGRLVVNGELNPIPQQFLASGYNEDTGEVIVKFVNSSEVAQKVDFVLDGVVDVTPSGKVVTLQAENPNDENTMDNPRKIIPREKRFKRFGREFSYTFPKYSFTVLRIKVEKEC